MIIKEVVLEIDNLKLDARLYIPAEKIPYPTICICHGIPSGIIDADDGGYPALAARICNEGFGVFIFSFRGTGKSEGNFDIFGWTRDLGTAIDYLWLQAEVDRSKIALLGFSAGAAVSICVGAQDKSIMAVASCACPVNFDSLIKNPEESLKHFRNIGIIKDKDFPEYDGEWTDNFKIVSPVFYISEIAPRPLLLVHGEKDDLVGVDDARILFERAKDQKKLVILEEAGHRLRRDERVVQVVTHWLREVMTGVTIQHQS
jgi:uncharacterized protein